MFKNTWLAAALLIAFSAVGSAAVLEFTYSKDVSDPAVTVLVTITDITGGVEINAVVKEGSVVNAVGDLRGLYFNYLGAVPSTATVTTDSSNEDPLPTVSYEALPSGSKAGPWNLATLPGQNAIYFEIGTPGGGQDFVSWIIYATDSNPALSAANFITGVARVTSVTRDGSLWLTNPTYPTPPNEENPIPEPSTWMMLSAGIGLLALARRRRAA